MPSKISVGTGSTRVFCTVGGNTPIAFMSVVKVKECCLIRPHLTSKGTHTKKLDAYMLGGEFTRSAFLPGMVLGVGNYTAPTGHGYCTFGGDWKDMRGAFMKWSVWCPF